MSASDEPRNSDNALATKYCRVCRNPVLLRTQYGTCSDKMCIAKAIASDEPLGFGNGGQVPAYGNEKSTSDEPRENVCSVCGMDPLDRRGEGEACTACGGGIASDEPRAYPPNAWHKPSIEDVSAEIKSGGAT